MTRKLLLILAIFNIALALTCAIVLTSMFLDSFPLFTDFYSLYSGWSLTAQRADVYDLGVQGARQTALLGASFPGGVLPYVSPPHAGLLFAPLAWLSLVLPTAAIVSLWNAAQILLAVPLVSLLASTAGGRFSFPVLSLRALTRTCHNRTGRH